MTHQTDDQHATFAALEWCLKYGVKAVDWGTTGYWHHKAGEGGDIMPPASLHVILDRARTSAINAREAESLKGEVHG